MINFSSVLIVYYIINNNNKSILDSLDKIKIFLNVVDR